MVIIDVGACVGEYTEYCLDNYNVDKIIMVEPLEANVEYLKERYKYLLNDKVYLVAGAVSDYNGAGELCPKIKTKRLPKKAWDARMKDAHWFADNNPGKGISYSLPMEVAAKHREELGLNFEEEISGWKEASNYIGNAGSVLDMTSGDIAINNDVMNSFYQSACVQPIGVCTIGHIVETLNIDHVDILKLDVEGSEYKILKGVLDQGSHKNIDKIFFEDHCDKISGMENMRDDVLRRIKSLGIQDKFWIQEDHLTYDVPLVETDMWKAIFEPEELVAFTDMTNMMQMVGRLQTKSGSDTFGNFAIDKIFTQEARQIMGSEAVGKQVGNKSLGILTAIANIPSRAARGFDDMIAAPLNAQKEAYMDLLISHIVDPKKARVANEVLQAAKPITYLVSQTFARAGEEGVADLFNSIGESSEGYQTDNLKKASDQRLLDKEGLTDDLKKSIDYMGKSEIGKKWGEYMSPIMKVEIDTNIGFPFLLPLMMHLD